MEFRLSLDGEWSAADFAALYKALNDLNFYFLAHGIPEARFTSVYAYLGSSGYYESRYDLRVTRIKYASPGFTDLAGLGAVIREVREFLQFVIDRYLERRTRQSAHERQSLEIAKLKLELIQELTERSQDGRIPLGAHQLLGLKSLEVPDIDPIIKGIVDGRITGIGDVAADDDPEP